MQIEGSVEGIFVTPLVSGQGEIVARGQNYTCWGPVPYFAGEVNPNLAKPPLKFNGGLAKVGLTSLVK